MGELAFRTPIGVGSYTPIVVSNSYESTLSLALHKNIGSNGVLSWVDMGSEYDRINTKVNIELLNELDYLKEFEENLKGGEFQTVTPVIKGATGFYPLTPLYKSCVKSGEPPVDNYYELSITNYPEPSQVNITGDAVQYSLDVIPNGSVLTLADTFSGCGKYTGWTLDGLELPFPISMPSPSLNIVDKSIQLNKGAYNAKRYRREGGETVKIDLKLDEENTRQLLSKLSTLRGSQFDIVTPLNYNYFAHLYPTNSSFKCILNSENIGIKYNGHKDITVTLSIRLVGVN